MVQITHNKISECRIYLKQLVCRRIFT